MPPKIYNPIRKKKGTKSDTVQSTNLIHSPTEKAEFSYIKGSNLNNGKIKQTSQS